MNENLNLWEVLKDAPKGLKLYSSVWGEGEFHCIEECGRMIYVKFDGAAHEFYRDGRYDINGECCLFPSKDQRDWSKFTLPKPKVERFDPKTLQPFQHILCRDGRDEETGEYDEWRCDLFSHAQLIGNKLMSIESVARQWYYCIPFNDDTKHLVGTTDEAPEYYRWWED